MPKPQVKTFYFADDGRIPNHPDLPLLFYPGALKNQPEQTERVFNQNGWLNSWTNGVFPYHHYHSNCHEVLGVVRGSAVLQLGGERGKTIEVTAGDVLVLPAGTGHKRLSASAEFKIAGAYPGGADYNLRTGEDGEHPDVLEEIRAVPVPDTDPVTGADGPLTELWKRPASA